MISFDKNYLNYENGTSKEWIIANHKGGYASSTIIGENTNKYHGLLILPKAPPRDRYLLVSKLEETILLNNKKYPLTNVYQENFKLDPFPTFTYKIENTTIEKKVFMIHAVNATIVTYSITSTSPYVFTSIPVIIHREINNEKNSPTIFTQSEHEKGTKVRTTDFNLYFSSDKGKYSKNEQLLENNQFKPGAFILETNGNEKFNVAMGDIGISNDFDSFYQSEVERASKLLDNFYSINKVAKNNLLENLVLTTDSFIVEDKNYYGIIAGYPLYTDWGRDTMISLPGLLLATGRYNEARSILDKYATYCKDGFIPHYISEKREPNYDHVDTSLFYIYAIYEFYKCKNDTTLIRDKLWNPIKSIIETYEKGVAGKLHMDIDGLLVVDSKTPVTWMDAKISNMPLTPRNGKPVELNALWYNSLKIAEYFADKLSDSQMKDHLISISQKVKQNFSKFWNSSEECLYDLIEPNDPSIRPNQLFAVSLDFPLVDNEKGRKIVQKVIKELLTPHGIMSLSKKDKNYVNTTGKTGDSMARAYHQGAIWVWPMGHFISAYLKTHGNKKEAASFLDSFFDQTNQKGLAALPEIYEPETFSPAGCISYAASLGEFLRAYVQTQKE
ncbi:glycogen debranching enzyme family protein [Candidatus Micrarchaeota archaeon]|nr:glycogen debranching enzyme family protein [Candidatus Micrarchaeota archaeon]